MYRSSIESVLTSCISVWFGSASAADQKSLQRIVKAAGNIIGASLPSLQEIFHKRCIRKASRIVLDSSPPTRTLCTTPIWQTLPQHQSPIDQTTSAQSTVEVSERIFTEMISSIERTRSKVTELIRDQEKAAVSQVEDYMERVEQEINELKRRHSEMEQLSRIQDHIHFLQRFQGIPVVPEVLIGRRFSSFLPCYFWKARKVVSDMKDQLENACTDTKDTLLPPLVPRTRAEFLQYSCWLSLDPNTANKQLCLSEDNRVVTWKRETQSHPDHQERFDLTCQVLCRENLTGRCYWEVQWSGTVIGIAVTYKGINRKVAGVASRLGYNDKSWCLSCSAFSYSFWHNAVKTVVSGPPSPRIGVYLDHGAGTLSFYAVSDTVTLLHRVQTTFTEPIYPGVVLYNSEARL
nr:tripartite motif-containing protein 16-like [Paramormyrops kingsleyae]